MAVSSSVLFGTPQSEIASQIRHRISSSQSTSIVTGFATPAGLEAISRSILADPRKVTTFVIGAATFPAFGVLDDLIAGGVPADRLFVHLGHTRKSGGRKNPFARFHPMMHSKIYYMEFADRSACAFVGSHNVTSFALGGLNSEAAILLDGGVNEPEFDEIRQHIATVRHQATQYSQGMKHAFAWWAREYIDGLRAEMELPRDETAGRTILVFAEAPSGERPNAGDQIYFEIPAGIEQIRSLDTETHLFLFATLPPSPWDALRLASTADAYFKCKTLGADNKQGNLEVEADWHIKHSPKPAIINEPTGVFRPTPRSDMQQVRAEVESSDLSIYEYLFERATAKWEPVFAEEEALYAQGLDDDVGIADANVPYRKHRSEEWKRVQSLAPVSGGRREKDEKALRLASPDSGSFIMVSLRRREKTLDQREDGES